VAVTEWAPATEAENAMGDALRVDDQELYFRILSRTELLLPISSDAIAGRAPMGWGTWTVGGRTHVLAFTSAEAMHACLAEHAGSARKIPYYELAAAWPNLEWWLAVNPGLPIEGYLPAWFISQLARGDVRMPGRNRHASDNPDRAETLGRAGAAAAPLQRIERLPARARVPVQAAASMAPVGMLLEGQLVSPPIEQPPEPPESPQPAAPPEPVETVEVPEPAAPASPFEPANDLESELLIASSGSQDSVLSVLLLAKVLLPLVDSADPSVRPGDERFIWRTDKIDDQPHVVVFTSPERRDEHMDKPAEVVAIRFVQLIRAWPDDSVSLAVNPGTSIGVTLSGAQIAGLVSSAAEVGLTDDAGAASESGAVAAKRGTATGRATVDQPVPMQKVIAPTQASWYLERSYDRVSGFVHREQEVAHLRSPAKLIAGLGLRYEGSPFDADAAEIYVLRWLAYRPSLYRIPYGGRTQAAMEAMEGWVIERPPFRGNGFAPSGGEDVIAEFKVDSVRLPHGAQLWRLRTDGSSQLVALLDADGPAWRKVEESKVEES
jgi:hypothetical protein